MNYPVGTYSDTHLNTTLINNEDILILIKWKIIYLYKMCSESMKTVAVFSKTQMNKKLKVDFLQNGLLFNTLIPLSFS